MDGQLVAMLHGAGHGVDVREVQAGVHALGVEVERQGDDVHVPGALAVAEQAAFHAVGAGHDAEFGGGHGRAPVVVRVQADDHAVAPRHVAVHPLHLVGVNIGGGHLHRRWQIEDNFVGGRGAPHGGDRVADLFGKFQLGGGEEFGAVLQNPLGLRMGLRQLFDQRDRVHSELHHLGLAHVEHHVAEQRRGGVVNVHDDAARTGNGLEGAADQVLARLGQDLDGHVLRDQLVVDQLAHKVEVGLRSAGETDLDFFEADLAHAAEHAQLALQVHGLKQRLVAVAQIGAHPDGWRGDGAAGPLAVRQIDGRESAVLGGGVLEHGNLWQFNIGKPSSLRKSLRQTIAYCVKKDFFTQFNCLFIFI